MDNQLTPQLKGLLLITAGALGYILVGLPFVARLVIACLSFIVMEHGLALLRLPTCWQSIQKLLFRNY